jgi:hypothetical protein
LSDAIADIEWETDNFTLLFLSLARHSDRIARAAENDLDDIPGTSLKDISSRSEVRYLSEDEINKEWRDVVSRVEGGSPTVDILISTSKSLANGDRSYFQYENESGIRSYLTVLSAPQIHELYTRHRDKLFNLNIRNYIGDTRTNKKIIETATTEGSQFFFYNNGISAVSTKVIPQANGSEVRLTCDNFSIINGAQTFRSISKAYTRPASLESTRKLRVLLRISEFDFRRPAGGETLDKITRYNNTQNSMQASDFRSNDDVQLSLVRYVNDVSAFGGKKYLYRNKRTQGTERNKISIKMDEFCRSAFAYQFGPADYFGGLTYLYGTGPDGGYVKLFGEELGPLSQPEFDRLFGIWLITSYVDGGLREEKKKLSEAVSAGDLLRKHALERKYLIFFALGEVFKEICRLRNIEEANYLRSFSKPRWQEEEVRRKFVDKAFSLACDMVVQAYQIAEGRPGFVHRNFFRENETLLSISNTKASRRSQIVDLASSTP